MMLPGPSGELLVADLLSAWLLLFSSFLAVSLHEVDSKHSDSGFALPEL